MPLRHESTIYRTRLHPSWICQPNHRRRYGPLVVKRIWRNQMIEQALQQASTKISIQAKYDNFIGGKFVAPVQERYFDNITPITGKTFTRIARSSAEDIELALDAAHAAKDAWGRTSPAERARLLNKIADRIEENLELIA